jgi:hypothetical protein
MKLSAQLPLVVWVEKMPLRFRFYFLWNFEEPEGKSETTDGRSGHNVESFEVFSLSTTVRTVQHSSEEGPEIESFSYLFPSV